MRQLLRIRDARIYLLGDVVSTLGDSALWLAMAIWLKELTGSSALAGLVFFCYALGSLASPIGGVVADRFRRRPLLIWANVAGAVIVMLIPLVHDRSQIWIVYLVIFSYGLIGSVIGPAQTALLPALVPDDLLASANALQLTLNEGLRIVTPLVGAGLFALLGAGPVAYIDAGTFGVAIVSLLALRVREPAPGLTAAGLAADAQVPVDRAESATEEPGQPAGRRIRAMSAGFRFIGRDPVLRAITVALALALLAFGFTESAAFSLVTVGLHHTASFIGVLNAVQGVGAIAGGLTVAPLLRRVPEGTMVALGLGMAVCSVLLLALPSIGFVLVGMVLIGFVGPWVIVAAITAIQRRTPGDLLGRVSGAFQLSLSLPQVTSVGLGAILIAIVSYRVLLVVIAVVAAASVAFLVSQPETRRRVPDVGAATATAAEDPGAASATGPA
jgi:MFS family permease